MAQSRFTAASREVAQKSDAAINRDSSLTWAARAEACFRRAMKTGNAGWFLSGRDHYHEALEHAGVIGDGGKLVARLDRKLGGLARKAAVAVDVKIGKRK